MKRKKLGIFVMVFMFMACNQLQVSASTNLPYQTYNYDYWEMIVYTPAAYVPKGNISGAKIGIDNFNNPQDVFVTDGGKVYIADTGNNRIVVLDDTLAFELIIDGFEMNGAQETFSNPSGIYVTEDNTLYIADTDHGRIVVLAEDNSFIRMISNPTSEVLDDGFVFNPLKVSVDYAGRVYSVAKNMFQGIMDFDENGNFTGFSGTIKISVSLRDKIWKRLLTKEQRSRQVQFIPTEFTGIDVAPDGFLYATNVDTQGTQSVRRLNPKGQDVIKKNNITGKLSGDIRFGQTSEYGGPSRITDVVYRGDGIYSILDTIRGRVFTYDHEGNILYIFGGKGTQEGTFRNPVAIETKDNDIYVLDSYRNELMIFSSTQYGSLITEAVALRYDGDEGAAVELWKQVLELDANFELAYRGIGKSYLAAGNNETAMEYLKLGMDREYYSIAYKRYRDKILKDNLAIILTSGLVLVMGMVVIKKVRNKKHQREDE